jgi:hypothetical protein
VLGLRPTGEQSVSPVTAAAPDVPALANARIVLALRFAVMLLVGILALAPSARAADAPTPDPSLDVRPDPAPVQSQAAPAKQRPAPVQQQAAPSGPAYLAPTSRMTQTTSPQSATTHSSRRRTSAAARARRSHERERRANRASAAAALQRLSPAFPPARLLRPPTRATSPTDDTGARALLFAGLALLLFAAASASLVRLVARDLGREPRW